MTTRLPISRRNAIIADFNAGINDHNYEVIHSKTTKGKYTVRKRTASIEQPQDVQVNEASPDEPNVSADAQEPHDDQAPLPEADDQTNSMFNPMTYFQEYQLQVNRLLIEQMKALRQNNKYMAKKQQKYKDRQRQIRDIFTEVANGASDGELKDNAQEPLRELEAPKDDEPNKPTEPQITSYFQTDYPQQQQLHKLPVVRGSPNENSLGNSANGAVLYNPQSPEQIQFKNDYEATLENMAGTHIFGSRRDRLKAFI